MARTKHTSGGKHPARKAPRRQLTRASAQIHGSPAPGVTFHNVPLIISHDGWSCNEEYSLKPDIKPHPYAIDNPFGSFGSTYLPTPLAFTHRTMDKFLGEQPDLSIKQAVSKRTTNKIVSFIQLSRQLLHCTPAQLKQFMAQMIDIFDQNDQYHDLTTILLGAFRAHYKDISLSLYQQIAAMDGLQPNLILDDSFPNDDSDYSDDEDDDKERKSNKYNKDETFLIKIPQDLISYTFNFVDISDVISASKTCRYLSTIAYNPNSIYHLTLVNLDLVRYATDARYSKIKSLTIPSKVSLILQNALISTVSSWNKLECLTLLPTTMYRFDEGNITLSLLRNCFPSALELKRLKLDMTNIPFGAAFITDHINHKCLRYLCLEQLLVTLDNIKALMCLSNLRTLSLASVAQGESSVWFHPDHEDLNALLLSNKQYSGDKYPFPHLHDIHTDCSLLYEENIDLLNWLLMNGPKDKSLTLTIDSILAYPTKTNTQKRFMKSLSGTNDLYLILSKKQCMIPLSICMSKWRYFMLHSKYNIADPEMQNAIDVLVANSKSSRLLCVVDNFDAMKAWITHHCRSNAPFFGSVDIKLENETIVNNIGNKTKCIGRCDNGASTETMSENVGVTISECTCVATDTISDAVLHEFETIEWFLNRGDNKDKLKQIGIDRIALDIQHRHKHIMIPKKEPWRYCRDGRHHMNMYTEATNKIVDSWHLDINNASWQFVNQYLSHKFKTLSKKKNFQFTQSGERFSFRYQIKC